MKKTKPGDDSPDYFETGSQSFEISPATEILLEAMEEKALQEPEPMTEREEREIDLDKEYELSLEEWEERREEI